MSCCSACPAVGAAPEPLGRAARPGPPLLSWVWGSSVRVSGASWWGSEGCGLCPNTPSRRGITTELCFDCPAYGVS